MRTMFFVLALTFSMSVSACGATSPTGPSPMDNPSTPLTGWQRVVDGAGNPGPATVRLIYLNPPQGSTLPGNGGLVSFRIEVSMDAVPNPTNSSGLVQLYVGVFGSVDGATPVGPTAAIYENGVPYQVVNGSVIEIKRVSVDQGGVSGHQFLYAPPGMKHLMVAMSYGLGAIHAPGKVFSWSSAPCPSYEDIARNGGANCVLRTSFAVYQ